VSKNRNAVLLTIDSLRYDHTSMAGYKRDTTPFMSSILDQAVSYDLAIANSANTPGAFPTILTGSYLLGREDVPKLSGKRKLISEILKEDGFRTAGFHSNAYLSTFYNYNRGWDQFHDDVGGEAMDAEPEKGSSKRIKEFIKRHDSLHSLSTILYAKTKGLPIPFLTAEELNDMAMDWLKNIQHNFFLWVHYLDSHNPYYPPDEDMKAVLGKTVPKARILKLNSKLRKCNDIQDASTLSNEEVKELIDLYDACIHHSDRAINDIMDRIKGIGHYDDTIFIITSDHGEQFREHGNVYHPSQLYDEQMRIPMLVKPVKVDVKTLGTGKGFAQHLDILPTIFEALGVKGEGLDGISLYNSIVTGLNPPERKGVFSEVREGNVKVIAYRTLDKKLIWRENGKHELYDLVKDPPETDNLFGKGLEFEFDFIKAVEEHITGLKSRGDLSSAISGLKLKKKI